MPELDNYRLHTNIAKLPQAQKDILGWLIITHSRKHLVSTRNEILESCEVTVCKAILEEARNAITQMRALDLGNVTGLRHLVNCKSCGSAHHVTRMHDSEVKKLEALARRANWDDNT